MTKPELIAERIVLELKNKGVTAEEKNGKYHLKLKKKGSTPWRMISHDERKNCALWRHVLYMQMYSSMRGMVFIPQDCQDCYKVVIRPKTWAELKDLEKILLKLNLPSKCGIELRLTVKGYYGGYIYCVGLEEGRERYKIARDAIPDTIPITLKRGCTEFEIEHGPSDKWEVTDFQREVEATLYETVTLDRYNNIPTDEELEAVHNRWREFAYKCDPTYTGPAHHAACVTYHE